MSWSELVVDKNFEINDETHEIRRKGTDRIIGEFLHHSGYIQLHLGKKSWLKHRILALQYLPNPDNLEFVDHIDLNKTNNSLSNLRWTSRLYNNCNKKHDIFIDTLPSGYVEVKQFKEHKFKDLYFANDQFYRWNGLKYKVLPKRTNNNGKTFYIHATNTNGENRCISYAKVKSQLLKYGFE